MSGPVWRRMSDGPYTCDGCLCETPEAMLEGEIEDGEFTPSRTLCDDCYRHNGRLIAKAS